MKTLAIAAALAATACQSTNTPLAPVSKAALADGPSATPYDTAPTDADYRAQLDAAIAALAPGHKALVVFGANWCHDSKALAGWLVDPRLRDQLAARGLTPVFIDVGTPQKEKGRNLNLVRRYGIGNLKSTPAMVVVDAHGVRLNTVEDAVAWRNAASRSEAAIRANLDRYAALAAH